MLRYCIILALCALFVQGCVPHTIVYAPPVEIRHTPDLNGAIRLACSSGTATAAVVAYRKPYYYAVTARHVIRGVDWLMADGQVAKVEAMSVDSDVALIRFKSLKTYTVYPLRRPELGQACWLVGWPWPGRIVNRGWISRVRGPSIWHNAGGANGCSGGPVLSAKGELLGIVTSYLVERDIGWIIPSRNVYNSLGRAVSAQEVAHLMALVPK